jgi:hypothetical protein
MLYAVFTHAENRPAPKPHVVALPIQPAPARLAAAVVQGICTAGLGSGQGRIIPGPSVEVPSYVIYRKCEWILSLEHQWHAERVRRD